MTAIQSRPQVLPLQPEDPPRVGEFWLRGRVAANAAGYLYAGLDDSGRVAVVAMMAEGAADDAAARDRFTVGVDRLPSEAVLARNSADDDDLALWVAVQDPDAVPEPEVDGEPPAVAEVARSHAAEVLSAVLMDDIPHPGRIRGPDFLHHWDGRRRPGLFRLWPLPWPGALRSASRLALLWSLLTMLLLMALALLIAWLLFRNEPEVDPGPVIPDPNGTATITVTPTTPPTAPGSSPATSGTPTTGPSPTPSGSPTGPVPTGSPSSPGTPVDPGDRF